MLGLGETGVSMVRYLSAQGARLRVADSRSNPPGLEEIASLVAKEQIHCGEYTDELFAGIDLIAISPGVALSEPCIASAIARGIPVAGDIELFAQHLATINDQQSVAGATALSLGGGGGKREKQPLILAITGSNGKTTVTCMAEQMCRAAGKDVVAAGNISPAVLDVWLQRGKKQPEVWVLELSSFQLETTSHLKADAAVVLNISEDHLDRYAGMDEYAAAKARIYNGSSVQVHNRGDVRCMALADKAQELAAVLYRGHLLGQPLESERRIGRTVPGRARRTRGTGRDRTPRRQTAARSVALAGVEAASGLREPVGRALLRPFLPTPRRESAEALEARAELAERELRLAFDERPDRFRGILTLPRQDQMLRLHGQRLRRPCVAPRFRLRFISRNAVAGPFAICAA